MSASGIIIARRSRLAFPAVIAAFPAITKAPAAFPAITKASAAVASLAALATIIAVDLAHHCRRTLFEFFNAHCQIAQNILVKTFQPLDFVDGGRRCIKVHESE